MIEPASLARVAALTERGRPDVVLVLAVLAVEELGGDHDRCGPVEQCDLEMHHREVPVLEADHALRADLHPLAARGSPDERAVGDTGPEVHRPLVLIEICFPKQERLVVDVELEELGVGHVDDRLAGLREGERLLGVQDGPGLVEAVQERAVRVGVAALGRVGPHAEVPVADREERLGQPEVVGRWLGLDQSPRLDREPMTGDGRGDVTDLHVADSCCSGRSVCARSSTTTSAPAASRASRLPPRSTPSTSPK